MTVALRTQQIIAEETGVANTVDPLGGSYAIEALTDRLESEAMGYINRIDELGGILRAVEIGYPQREIADAAFAFQMAQDAGEYVTVGVNGYVMDEPENDRFETLKIGLDIEHTQRRNTIAYKAARDARAVADALARIGQAASDGSNLMPPIVDGVRAGCTVGEISDVFREKLGVYGDPAWI